MLKIASAGSEKERRGPDDKRFSLSGDEVPDDESRDDNEDADV